MDTLNHPGRYIIVGAYTGKVYDTGVDRTIAEDYAHGYRLALPALAVGDSWRCETNVAAGIIITRQS